MHLLNPSSQKHHSTSTTDLSFLPRRLHPLRQTFEKLKQHDTFKLTLHAVQTQGAWSPPFLNSMGASFVYMQEVCL